MPQAEALAYLEGLEEGQASQRSTSGRDSGLDPRLGVEILQSLAEARHVFEACTTPDALRPVAARGRLVVDSLEGLLMRVECAAADAEASAARLRQVVEATEGVARSMGARPGYGPPRPARSHRQDVPDDRADDVDLYVDGVRVGDPVAHEDGDASPSSDLSLATSGI